ncbi:hypothetical protein [Actinospica robiniae]|uniref:hypothetical protein n=1 Tax=Actinospica robiniae TaxID=304901 RepID=UPI000426F91E|nr:hypothetical protein [Actinospica robiniae]
MNKQPFSDWIGDEEQHGTAGQSRFDPAEALHRLAQEAAPPSRIDVAKAARDGFLLRRRHKIVRSLAGVAAVGAVATAGLLLPDRTLGTANPRSSDTCPTLVGEADPGPGDYRTEVPGRFGWLPSDEVSQVSQAVPFFDGGFAISTSSPYVLYAASASDPDVEISLSVYAYAAQVPGQQAAVPPGCPATSVVSTAGYRIAARNVNGGKAYWFTIHPDIIDDEGSAELVWQTPSGTWASVSGSYLEINTAEKTLEHVADTAVIGTTTVATPLQIKGVPARAQMRLAQVQVDRPVDGGTSAYSVLVTLTFGTGANRGQVEIWAGPPDEDPDADPLLSYPSHTCRTITGWRVCAAETRSPGVGTSIAGGLDTVLRDLVVCGQDTSTWSADLITGTK